MSSSQPNAVKTSKKSPPPAVRNYFVDEAGDPTLFGDKGKIIVGDEGCSTHFMLGVLEVDDPIALAAELRALRQSLLADPYFRKVPSMLPARRKTAVCFHAKDDLPEIRRDVFSVLMKHPLRFYAVVRDKRAIARGVVNYQKRHPEYRYHPNQLYDRQVGRLFTGRLHKAERIEVCFATRGTSDRTAALRVALEGARDDFCRRWGITSVAPIGVTACKSAESAGLQAADYFLWALQRLYSKRDDRYLSYVYPAVGMVHDLDDTRQHGYGVYYSQGNPLTADKLQLPLMSAKKTPGI